MRYMVVIEKSPRNYSAYSPDVTGGVGIAKTLDEVTVSVREGIEIILEDLVERGMPLPEPTASAIDVQGYAVPIAKTPLGYRAEPPDFPHIIAGADTRERAEALIRETIADYLAWHCKRPPAPTAQVIYVDVEAPAPVAS